MNSSWRIFELIKTLEIKTSMVFNLIVANNTIFSCFFFVFFIIHLYFLIAAVITQFSIVATELAIPSRIPNKEAKEEIETRPVRAEAKKSKCSLWFKIL